MGLTMVTTPASIVYPESDGQPMADNTQQFECIVYIKKGLDWLFNDDPLVFVAGDLLWYPVEGDNKRCQAPDAMVVFDRPKGDRGSYQQWKEDNVPPQVVFEVISPSNTIPEMTRKFQFYERYGVEEYYLYDPDRLNLGGFLRQGDRLEEIAAIEGWVSPRLQVRLELGTEGQLVLYRPDGQPFESYEQLAARAEQERQRAEAAEQRSQQAQSEIDRLRAQLQALGQEPE
ncbi:MAG TPA: Uma2 family endonuclease [Thermosynechococcaceae cyanobacterium]